MPATWTRIEPLVEAESLRRLNSARWGRCAWNGPEGPRILPVNHAVVDGNVVFRTGLYGTLAGAGNGHAMASEADELIAVLHQFATTLAGGADLDELMHQALAAASRLRPSPRLPHRDSQHSG